MVMLIKSFNIIFLLDSICANVILNLRLELHLRKNRFIVWPLSATVFVCIHWMHSSNHGTATSTSSFEGFFVFFSVNFIYSLHKSSKTQNICIETCCCSTKQWWFVCHLFFLSIGFAQNSLHVISAVY